MITYHLTNADYHQLSALGSSSLKTILVSPEYAKWRLDNPMEPSDAFALGNAVHIGLLEPERIDSDICIAPKTAWNLRSNKGKAERDEWMVEHNAPGKVILSPDEYDKAMRMVDKLWGNKEVDDLMSLPGRSEVSIFDTHESGLPVKTRPDRLCKRDRIVIDLKTTRHTSAAAFQAHACKLHYDLQAASQVELTNRHTPIEWHFTIAVSSEANHAVFVFIADKDLYLRPGLDDWNRACWIWKSCLDSNEWPDTDSGILTLTLPQWRLRQLENDL